MREWMVEEQCVRENSVWKRVMESEKLREGLRKRE